MRSAYTIRPSSICDIRALGTMMRADDAAEAAGLGLNPRRALWRTYRSSLWSKTAIIDGEVGACFGMAGGMFSTTGQPWLVTAPAVERVPISFVKEARKEIARMLTVRSRLENTVAADYHRAIRFLRVLGFMVYDPEPVSGTGALFCRYVMER